jgi:UDP-N-acetyl-D-galactosamine dehydrogenase
MTTVAVVGLGYVGLPLAVEFGKRHRTIGFDLSKEKVDAYRRHVDPTGEVSTEELRASRLLEVGSDPAALAEADFIVVAVPTPVDEAHQPDFSPLLGASQAVGKHMKRGATVVYESTVYPGATEEICIPVLEKHSNMRWRKDFNVGYSPERINPGDKERTLTKITKVVSGDTPETLERVAQMYGSVVDGGVHRASSIKVAEAAKVIENTQRDLNIALMNELAIIFDRLGIDTMEGAARGGHEVEFPAVSVPGLVGRALHRRRPVLPDAQGGDGRLSPRGDSRGPADQRRHGQVRRRADGEASRAQRLAGQCGAGHRARPYVQGGFPDLRNSR